VLSDNIDASRFAAGRSAPHKAEFQVQRSIKAYLKLLSVDGLYFFVNKDGTMNFKNHFNHFGEPD
jgi:hypothetical protein